MQRNMVEMAMMVFIGSFLLFLPVCLSDVEKKQKVPLIFFLSDPDQRSFYAAGAETIFVVSLCGLSAPGV